jgi:hypothetical protein
MGGREIIIITKTGNSVIIGNSGTDSVRIANTVYSSMTRDGVNSARNYITTGKEILKE